MEDLNMRISGWQGSKFLALSFTVGALVALSACSINVKKSENGENKKVDIDTPVGGIHVSNDADARDAGVPVYPGARMKQKDSSGEEKSANVNITGPGFALKVVAIEYESDDPPEKLIAFYKDQLKKYGKVLECHSSRRSGDVTVNPAKHQPKHDSRELTCGHDDGKTIELKVGTEDNQHLVAIEPRGQGSSFALVFVKTRDEGETI